MYVLILALITSFASNGFGAVSQHDYSSKVTCEAALKSIQQTTYYAYGTCVPK